MYVIVFVKRLSAYAMACSNNIANNKYYRLQVHVLWYMQYYVNLSSFGTEVHVILHRLRPTENVIAEK